MTIAGVVLLSCTNMNPSGGVEKATSSLAIDTRANRRLSMTALEAVMEFSIIQQLRLKWSFSTRHRVCVSHASARALGIIVRTKRIHANGP